VPQNILGGHVKIKTIVEISLAFLIAFFAVGIEYWQIPYSKVSLPNSLYGIGLAILFLVSTALRLVSAVTFLQTLSAVGLAVPAMVMARVVVETSRDPTSHNLWPLEIIIAAGVGLAVASAGALVGGLLARFFKSGSAVGGT